MIDKTKIRTDIKAVYPDLDAEELLENLGIQIAQRSGDEIQCHCPFSENHANGDRNPSFCFNTKKMVAVCFVCGGRTLLELVKYCLDLDDAKGEEWIREQAVPGLGRTDLKEKVLSRLNQVDKKDPLPEYSESILDPYRIIHPYLYERGLSKEVIIKMRVGYDEEHDAIVIPHFFKGKLRGWQRRHLSECLICPDTPKYKSSSDFPKTTTLYNYDNLSEDQVILVESPMSALKLITYGYNVAATFGSWSKKQIDLLAGAKSIILWPDNDESGRKSLLRIMDDCVRLAPTRVAPILPNKGGDPGDLEETEINEYLKYTYPPVILRLKGLKTLEELEEANQVKEL